MVEGKHTHPQTPKYVTYINTPAETELIARNRTVASTEFLLNHGWKSDGAEMRKLDGC